MKAVWGKIDPYKRINTFEVSRTTIIVFRFWALILCLTMISSLT